MADSYFVAGYAANACVRAQGVTVTDEHALADFQSAKLLNGNVWEPFIAATPPATDWEAVFDTNQVYNPSFELDSTGEAPTGWTIESGTPTVETEGNELDGTKSLRLNAADEAAYQEKQLVAGKVYRLEADMFGDGAEDVEIYLIDTATGKYKTTASQTSWTATPTALFTRSTGSWATSTQTFTVDATPAGGRGLSTLRVRARKDAGTGAAYVDNVIIYPYIDFISLHDFHVHDAVSISLHSSDDNFVGDDDTEVTLLTRRLRTYATFTPQSATPKRWRKLLFTGTGLSPIRIGQACMGEATLFGVPQYGEGSKEIPQGGLSSDGVRMPINLASDGSYRFDLAYRVGVSNFDIAVQQLIGQSKNGQEPIAIVLDTSETDRYPVMYGRAPSEHTWERVGPEFYRHSMLFEEDPFAVELTA